MQPNELYLLSPLAWTHAQEILARESDMIGRGVSDEDRAAFIERECERLQEHAVISLPESVDAVIADLSRTDIVEGYDAMRERFRRHGFAGTTRSIRNLSRRLGAEEVSLDIATTLAGFYVLRADVEFATTAQRTFQPFLDKIMAHPSYAEGEQAFNELEGDRILPSEKGRRAHELAVATIREVLDSIGDMTIEKTRDVAYLRGRLLDVDLADVMSALISNGGLPTVIDVMRASINAQYNQYCDVLQSALSQRIDELTTDDENQQESEPIEAAPEVAAPIKTNAVPIPQSPLLTMKEAMIILNVSRSTVNRLIETGAIEKLKVLSRTMVTRRSIDAYLATT